MSVLLHDRFTVCSSIVELSYKFHCCCCLSSVYCAFVNFFNWANFIAFLYCFMTRTMCSLIFFTWAKTCISVLLHGLCTVRNHVLFFVEIWFGFRCLLAYSAAAWLKFVYWKQCDAYKLIFMCCSSWSDMFTVHIDVVFAW
jgi:hypothetical protein